MWLDEVEDGAMQQLKNLANLPFVYKWICAMPDCHQGYGMPIGGVMATKDVIVPNAVGVDIGCGMCAVKTSLTEIDTDTLKKIMGEIRKAIPVGFNHHKKRQDEGLMPKLIRDIGVVSVVDPDSLTIVEKEYENALTQIGTLGGGNHFIEIQKGSDGHIWIMIHSGSRNLGYKVADYYNKLAVKLNEKWHSLVPREWELAFLPVDSDEGQTYLKEMEYCVDFARANRELMMERILSILGNQFNCAMYEIVDDWENVEGNCLFNIAHNYASLENHFGENVWVHRKGATLARKGTIGIIPGSMGTKSYIVEGLGNPESFMSCSHGAGRKMGRKEAIRNLNLKEEQDKMEGIIGAPRTQGDLEEAPGAYKSIEDVMRNQEDLVKILIELTPLAVIKG